MKIDVRLGHARGVDARRPLPRYGQGPSRAFPAAHGQDYGFGLVFDQAVSGGRGHALVRAESDHGSFGDIGDAQSMDAVDETLRVFGSAQGFAEAREAEAVVDTLAQNAAQVLLALEDDDFSYPAFALA